MTGKQSVNRREVLRAAGAAAAAGALGGQAMAENSKPDADQAGIRHGRINQSIVYWCFKDYWSFGFGWIFCTYSFILFNWKNVNYMFKEDMISDGIENCVQYIHNFNPEKSQNPFAYFTQIIHYAFLRRIQREKRQLEIKNKIIERSGYQEVFDDNNTIDGSNYSDYNQIKDAVHSKLRN